MTDISTEPKQDAICIDSDSNHEDGSDGQLNCFTWDTPSSIIVRVPYPDPKFSDPNYDRFFFVNPRPIGLQILEKSGLEIREMYVVAFSNGSLNLLPVKTITTWPVFTSTGEAQSVLTCTDGKTFLVSSEGLIRLHTVTKDWDGTGRYQYQNEPLDTPLSLKSQV